MATQNRIIEATETIVKVVRISGKTKPIQINGANNTDNVIFMRAFDAQSGDKINTPLSITESRAKMFGFSCLCINPEAAEQTNDGLVEELNTLANPPKYYEMTLRVIPEAEDGVTYGYRTKKAIKVGDKEYKANDLVPYRAQGTYIIEAIGKEYKESDFRSPAIEEINNTAQAVGDMAYKRKMFELLYSRKPVLSNSDDIALLMAIKK